MSNDWTQFKSVTSIGDSLVSDQLEANVIAFFDWGFLQAGGFFNVTFPSTGTSLRRASDPDYQDGQVFEGYRQNWVWESGVPASPAPIAISGVWVNGTLQRPGTGYFIDYPRGRVVFASPLPTGTAVALEYAFRRVLMDGADADWFKELQRDTINFGAESQTQFSLLGSGSWNTLAQNRIQLPAIVVEAVSRVRQIPFQLGSTSQVHEQDVIFHVIAETPYDRKQLHDVVVLQKDKRVYLFDKNAIDDANAWPLDFNGTPVSGALTYPAFVNPSGAYFWRGCSIVGMRSEPQTSFPPVYRATCRATLQIDLP